MRAGAVAASSHVCDDFLWIHVAVYSLLDTKGGRKELTGHEYYG
jgi:hypothetical protein